MSFSQYSEPLVGYITAITITYSDGSGYQAIEEQDHPLIQHLYEKLTDHERMRSIMVTSTASHAIVQEYRALNAAYDIDEDPKGARSWPLGDRH